MHIGVCIAFSENKAEAQNRSRLQVASCIPAKRTQIGGNLPHICRHSKRLTTIGESQSVKKLEVQEALPPAGVIGAEPLTLVPQHFSRKPA